MMKSLAAILVLALTACGSSEAPSNRPAGGPVPEGSGPPGATEPRSGRIDPPAMQPGGTAGGPAADRMAWRQSLDTDHDGTISPAEREAGRTRRQSEMRAQMDLDHDGRITLAERAAARHQRAQDLVTRFDTNGDGRLATTELPRARWFQNDLTVDANQDGFLTADELEAAMTARFEKRKAERQNRAPGANAGSGGAGGAPRDTDPDSLGE
jgi:Ca2+-binding EF-hand superfamily protein